MGLVAGTVLVAFLTGMTEGVPSARQFLTLGGYALLMTAVCFIACVVPTHRALAVEPTEALRES